MKNLTINGNTFQMNKESYTFLSNYIDRLKHYIKKNKLDQDLYDDIMTRLEEKLAQTQEKKKEITQKEAIQIVNSLGEPEDIFENEESTSLTQQESFSTNTKTKRKYSFWIKLIILVFWTFVLIGIFGLSDSIPAITIIILATTVILMARYTYNYDRIREYIQRDFSRIGKRFSRMRKNMLIVARIVFFCGFGLFLITITIPIILGLGAYFGNFTLNNMEVFSLTPWTLPIAAILGGVSLVLFAIFFISYGVRKKGIGNNRTMIASISLFAGILFTSISGFSIFKTYFGELEKTSIQEENIQITDTNPIYDILFSRPQNTPILGADMINFYFRGADIKPSPDNNMKVITEIVRFGPEEQKKNIFNYMQPLTIKKQENRIEIGYENQKIFTKKVPFVPMQIRIKELHIPKNMKFTSETGKGQISLPTALEKYEPKINTNDCEYYFYDKKREIFSCHIDPKNVEEIINARILPSLVRESISDLSPIKHNEEYKRRYYDDYDTGISSDRKVSKIDRTGKDGKQLTIHYNDKSLMITATATLQDYIESASLLKDRPILGGNIPPFIISDFKIIKITKNPDIYREKYYQNPEIIEKIRASQGSNQAQ